MAKLNLVYQLSLLALIFLMAKVQVANSKGTFHVDLDTYYEKTNNFGKKCIKLCVKTSPSGFPRCNLNTTSANKGIATVNSINQKSGTGYPNPYGHTFQFTEWKDNSELSVTVWKLLSGQSCNTTSPTNNTIHGDATIIIPQLLHSSPPIKVDAKWKLKVRFSFNCLSPGCLPLCVPRDNSTGHYTCHEGNKKCLPNWFGEHKNCTIFCNKTSSTYKCRENGSRTCNSNQFGRDCDVFCDKNATNYRCAEDGRRTCLPNWFNQNCDQFCNSSGRNYLCDNEGHPVCFLHWYGEQCTKYCNNSATHYKCNDKGDRVCLKNWFEKNCTKFCNNSHTQYTCNDKGDRICLRNWYGVNCSKFCNNSNENFKCNVDGDKICLKGWYGKNCTKFCNNSHTQYTCNDKGDRICLRNWYGVNCSKFCNNSNKQFKCNVEGDKVCLRNWFGKDCTKFCNNSHTQYTCNDNGERICLRNWYGVNCSRFCNNSNGNFKCSFNGDKICLRNWFGKDCKKFCNNSHTQYTCNDNGERICLGNWHGVNCDKIGQICTEDRYGQDCNIHCTTVGRQESGTLLYYCEIVEEKARNIFSCPEGWYDTSCLEDCESIEEVVQTFKEQCKKSNGRELLCSNKTVNKCGWKGIAQPLAAGKQKGSRHDMKDVKIYGGLFGTLFLMVIITTIVVVYISLKKKKARTTSPDQDSLYEIPREMMAEDFYRKFNRAEITLNVDELLRKQSNATELGYVNEGMMVENPLYNSTKKMRAGTPFKSTAASPDEVFSMSNVTV